LRLWRQLKGDDDYRSDEEHQEWLAYALEKSDGRVVFHYNLTWEQIGSHYNGKLQETQVSLDEIETVLMPGDAAHWRWLPIEVIEAEQAEAYLEQLNERCCIPKPQPATVRYNYKAA